MPRPPSRDPPLLAALEPRAHAGNALARPLLSDATRMRRRTLTLLTNHAHVLFILARDPTVRVRDLALRLALTERAVLRMISELEAAGYVRHRREGRRNVYELLGAQRLAHHNEAHLTVEALVAAFGESGMSAA